MLIKVTVPVILLFLGLPVLSAAQVTPELREAMRACFEAVWKKDAIIVIAET